ncbi:DUF4129 domain-containing protein [Singulisphaera acidiphila]|uniref:Protein-glutamine gamma-glutamyltransferase-like C-terminal domain-containing protein n=1 Tax=Singulisphaera acidiphila (strain ATCC BAA-1392 / DSM 18658 / VKM B-2454 / MOB10) TaxID=886293 RepID=L0DAS4_SINAD|nr:DUF4129 domain-containing protein [Singulisphaera acidiphila]AGA26474.1 hypothetical protein Sinac_2140 [Singulisphaera acidiphila DSM 18658]
MARTRSQDTMVDHLVAAIVPALIMVMVGGLMLFLLDIWYEGPFLARLRWILFWFVFGIVLITRVGMQIGGEQAKGYGVALGGAVGLVATSLAGFQPFLLAVMGLVWWATHKLTYDCTLIDEDQDAGVGLLQESGLDPSAAAYAHDDPEVMDASLLPNRPWWKHWGRDPGEAHRPHPPGVWLIYFSLASLPVFGLGQWLVPAVEADRRAGLLFYFLAYVASAMGLLLATSFLNLRRYLRKRKIPMPGAMTATWLTTGAVMVIGLTVTSAVLLPLLSGFRTMSGASLASSDRRASRWAMLKDGGVQGEGAASEGAAASKSARPRQESGKPEGSGKTNNPNAARQTNGQGRQGGQSGPGRSKSGAPRGKPSSSKGGVAGKQGGRQDRSSSQDKGQDQADRGKEAEPDSRQGNEQDSERDDNSSTPPDQGPNNPVPPSSLSFQAPSWLRIPVLIAGIIFLIFGAVRYGPDLLKGLWAMIGALLGGLWFGGPKKPKAKEDAEASSAPEPPPQPFASFANPFDTGLDHRLKPDDLVIYSFEALEAWAYEHDLGRSPHETPTEFVRRVGKTRPGLGADAVRLASFFVTITYGRRGFKAEILPHLRKFWRAIEGGGAPAIAEHTADV